MTPLLQQWATEQAERHPDRVSVVLDRHALTYAELEESSNRLARALRTVGCRPGDRVCLLMPKTPTAIVSILGALKADCIYVPIDPASPPLRIARILDLCEPSVILAAGPTSRVLDALIADGQRHRRVALGWMDTGPCDARQYAPVFGHADLAVFSGTPLDYGTRSTDPAYILFTSGSTGIPKGVVITHASVIHFVSWACRYFGVRASDRLSGHPPLHFDLSVSDIFCTLATGAELHLVPSEFNLLPTKLADFIRGSELTQWFSVPSVLSYLAQFDVIKQDDFPALKRVLWCGEVFPTRLLIYWMKRLPHVSFTNLYGPTETTIASSYYAVPSCPDDAAAQIPIGTACDHEELLVLDERLRPVSPGETGDLYIRGVGLSPGYWRDPERTRAVFLPNPLTADPRDRLYKTGDLARTGADGLVYFLGRADSQIKSRGYRIELTEVETALNAIDALQECAVVAVASEGFEGTVIACGYVPAPGRTVTPATLRNQLSDVLPAYMLPSRWLALDRLPKNANGKIDRRALREALTAHEAPTAR